MNVRDAVIPIQLFFIVLLLIGLLFCPSVASEKWPGVDETVIEKIAQEHGRAAREPLINTDQGNLLLFLFLMVGAIGGFTAGYYWRVLIQEKRGQISKGNGAIC